MTKNTDIQTTFEDHPDHSAIMQRAKGLDAISRSQNSIREIEANIRIMVEISRRNGATWQEVGDALGVTRSAAQKYYGPSFD